MSLPAPLGSNVIKEWRRDSDGTIQIRYADLAGIECWARMDFLFRV